MELAKKRVLITGGAVRIGRAIAETLASAGAHVGIHYNRSHADAVALCDQLTSQGRPAWTVQGDLSSESGCRDVMEQAIASMGSVDILINNASVFHKDTLEDSDMDVVMDAFWTNLFAPMQLVRFFAEQNRPGAVVNLLDRRITSLDTACVPYLLAKKSLAELTRLAALHYAPRIAVNGVAPGAILPPPGKDGAYLKDHAGWIPLAVACQPEDVARTVRFVLESDTMTGQVIFVDGGQHLQAEQPQNRT